MTHTEQSRQCSYQEWGTAVRTNVHRAILYPSFQSGVQGILPFAEVYAAARRAKRLSAFSPNSSTRSRNARAAADGFLRPCSQSEINRCEMPVAVANAACVRPRPDRMRATSTSSSRTATSRDGSASNVSRSPLIARATSSSLCAAATLTAAWAARRISPALGRWVAGRTFLRAFLFVDLRIRFTLHPVCAAQADDSVDLSAHRVTR